MNPFETPTTILEVKDADLSPRPGAAFGGVLNLGLLTAARLADSDDLPGVDPAEVKDRLRQLADTCAHGVQGVGVLLQYLPQNHGPTGRDLWGVGCLLENLGKLIGEAMEQVEVLSIEESRARRGGGQGRVPHV